MPDRLKATLPVVETPSGGFHILYRCSEICGCRKLAMWEQGAPTSRGVRIETRGEGGCIVADGSPPETHATGNPYVQVCGVPLPQIPVITPEERSALHQIAMSFDCAELFRTECNRAVRRLEKPKRKTKPRRRRSRKTDLPVDEWAVTPWDDFDRRADWPDLLTGWGWKQATDNAWSRPGKDFGVSASIGTNDDGIEILTVFSTSPMCGALAAQGTDARASFGAFRALCKMNHGGDNKEAIRAVLAGGYGTES